MVFVLAQGETKSITELGRALDFWLCNDITTKKLAENFSFVTPNGNAVAFDENREVEYKWNQMLQNGSMSEIHSFVKVAIDDEVINKLFPFTSLYTLCFSRCTGYPFDTSDLPNVTPKEFENYAFQLDKKGKNDNALAGKRGTIFVVTRNRIEYIGEGNALEALRIVKECLPKNLQPARKGTLDG